MPADVNHVALTYEPVGVTRAAAPMPDGMRSSGTTRVVGGPEVFEQACDFVMGLGMQRALRMRVEAPERPLEVGDTVTMRAGFGRFAIRIPTRVVYLIHEGDRRGFAYGTLPGHPERGEELFLVERLPAGAVRVSVSAVSAPGRWYTRMAGPFGRQLQRAATWRYVDATRRHCLPQRP